MKLTKTRLKEIIKEELGESKWYSDKDETFVDHKFRMEQEMNDPEYLASLELDPEQMSHEDVLNREMTPEEEEEHQSRDVNLSSNFIDKLKGQGINVENPREVEEYLRANGVGDFLLAMDLSYLISNAAKTGDLRVSWRAYEDD